MLTFMLTMLSMLCCSIFSIIDFEQTNAGCYLYMYLNIEVRFYSKIMQSKQQKNERFKAKKYLKFCIWAIYLLRSMLAIFKVIRAENIAFVICKLFC